MKKKQKRMPASMSRVHNLASRLAEHFPETASPDDSAAFVLDLLQSVPVAMELAAEFSDLAGDERKDLVVRALLYAMGRMSDEYYGGKDEKRAAVLIAESLIPVTGDMLYAAYRHRHTFRHKWRRRLHKFRACLGR